MDNEDKGRDPAAEFTERYGYGNQGTTTTHEGNDGSDGNQDRQRADGGSQELENQADGGEPSSTDQNQDVHPNLKIPYDERVDVDFTQGESALIIGTRGQGKTYWIKHYIEKQDMRVMVFTPHPYEWEEMRKKGNALVPDVEETPDGLNEFMRLARDLAQDGIIDMVVVDEAYKVAYSNKVLGSDTMDVNGSCRHYGLTVAWVSHQPQHIAQIIYGDATYIVAFRIRSDNAQRKLNKIDKPLGDYAAALQYKGYEYAISTLQVAEPKLQRKL